MNTIIINLLIYYAVLVSSQYKNHEHSQMNDEGLSHLHQTNQELVGRHINGLELLPKSNYSLGMTIPGPENWNMTVEGFSPAYYDKVREAIAVNTVEQPTDKWAAASTTFEQPSGMYTIRFTSLLESDGECSYILRVGPKKVLEFQNPRIYGKDIAEYAPHEEEVKNVSLEQGSLIQVEFLPHSNGLVPEGEGFGYARARWKDNIEFIPQKE